ncbi:hypothetical protein AA23498_3601 [Acetobacter nitrogenifigens DSM 23921 = NBRC 105050]|uniref:Antitoxin VbhA domain-containing protein n=1 Tax=Acetobacter nitrogenifigens DSM 23921 = NBRC 105050 TaxID=1120919 RepID=A0A511XFE4_9PROT|nr:hypothetical protein [Acetobacter nitrogenifigens]GBR00042.1 hypothetical protein AA23498_3601 [Acetobacter nitrogenifigens DSM 23921 = NBRC 105050]GEN61677.1 hypothetical protein ANI02nite_35610 [Acetobacter nitrogenifigens DSM 23921 = NBRC 105050]
MEQTVIARPISAEESERRRRAAEEARASDYRQGYVHDPVLEEATDRYVAGLMTLSELGSEMRASIRKGD